MCRPQNFPGTLIQFEMIVRALLMCVDNVWIEIDNQTVHRNDVPACAPYTPFFPTGGTCVFSFGPVSEPGQEEKPLGKKGVYVVADRVLEDNAVQEGSLSTRLIGTINKWLWCMRQPCSPRLR